MNHRPILLVGGGQAYYGDTAERDRRVVEQTAKELFKLVGNQVEIVTGGMPGIPADFVQAWMQAGVIYEVHGETQKGAPPSLDTSPWTERSAFCTGW